MTMMLHYELMLSQLHGVQPLVTLSVVGVSLCALFWVSGVALLTWLAAVVLSVCLLVGIRFFGC